MAEHELPADLLELQRRRDRAIAAVEAHALVPCPDAEDDPEGHAEWTEQWNVLWAQARDAVVRLHDHPWLRGPDRLRRIAELRAAARRPHG